MDYIEKINEVIESALTERTFSLEIIQKIKEIREELAEFRETDKDQRERIASQIVSIDSLNAELSDFKAKETELKLMEVDLLKRGRIIFEKETRAEFQKEKADLIERLFNTVFRNAEIRKDIFKTAHITNNGYSSTQPDNEQEVRTIA